MIESGPKARDYDYPWYNLAHVAKNIGVFDNPDVADLHRRCLTTHFEDEVSYDQGVLALLHACDMAYQDNPTPLDLQGIALCLADVHFRTGHYQNCWEELLFANEHPGLERFLEQALVDVERHLADGYQQPSPVTARILVDY